MHPLQPTSKMVKMFQPSQSTPIPPENLRRAAFPTCAAFLLLYLFWLLWGRSDPWERFLIGDMAMLFSSLVVAVLAIWAWQRISDPRLRIAWGWLSSGLVVWAFTDLGRMLLQARSAGFIFTPSFLDVLYLVGSVLLWVGLLQYPRQPRPRLGRLALLFDLAIVTTGALTLVWLVVIDPSLPKLPSGLSGFLVLLYPLVDLLTLMLVAILFLLMDAERTPAAFSWLSLGLMAYIFSDLAYASLLLVGGYQSGTPLDIGWVVGDALVGLGALSQGIYLEEEATRSHSQFTRRFLVRFQSLLPLLMVVITGWYSLLEWQFSDHIPVLGLWVTLILGLGLIARQGILTGEVEMQQYANLVNSIAEPAFVCDQNGLLRLINPALLETTGYSRHEDLLDQPLQKILHPAEEVQQILRTALKSRTDHASEGWSGELNLLQREGGMIPVSLALRPLLQGRRGRLALAGTAHNLSEQKHQQAALQVAYEQIAFDRSELEILNVRLEQRVAEKTADLTLALVQLEQQNRTLLQLDELKTEFVSLVSHELRAPLTNISGGIELLMGGSYPLDRRVSQNLVLVQAEIRRLARFVETILDLSALDAGRMPLYPAPLSLHTITENLQRQLSHLQDSRRVHWELSPYLPVIMADEQALNSVFFHLLDNAFKYAPLGEIIVSAGVENAWIKIAVSDEGPGLVEDAIPMLFERFYRSGAVDSQTVYGHGLGLYIVRRLLEAMNGRIQASNRPEGGACFTFYLPFLDEGEGQDAG